MHWHTVGMLTCLWLGILGALVSGVLDDVGALLVLVVLGALVVAAMACLWIWLGAWRELIRNAL